MRLRSVVGAFLALASSAIASPPSAQQLAQDLQQISLDPNRTYRVRDLSLDRGGVKLYLNEGVLSFLTPVDNRTIAALFTTDGVEAGDAELILMPPRASERASLASFAKRPNLDEHFGSGLFFFSDNTAAEIAADLNRSPLGEAPGIALRLADRINPVARSLAGQLEVTLLQALLDKHTPADGLFYAVLGGHTLGTFDFAYDPTQAESVYVGRAGTPDQQFQLWTNFRPRRAAPFTVPSPRVQNYHLDSTIHDDLSMDVRAEFERKTDAAAAA